MDGNVVPEIDSFTLGNEVTRPRAEHSHLTIGMWACAAIAVGEADLAQAFSDELLKYYESGADYWGNHPIPTMKTHFTMRCISISFWPGLEHPCSQVSLLIYGMI